MSIKGILPNVMEKLAELIAQAIKEFEARLSALESRTISLFGNRTKVADTPEIIEERRSEELQIVQQYRPQNHPTALFLFRFLGRGNFFHSLDSQGGTNHVHIPGAVFDDSTSSNKGFYVGGQLREVVLNGKKELQYIRYIASPKTADVRHPNFETDPNIRILEVKTVSIDGEFVLNDTDERRALN